MSDLDTVGELIVLIVSLIFGAAIFFRMGNVTDADMFIDFGLIAWVMILLVAVGFIALVASVVAIADPR